MSALHIDVTLDGLKEVDAFLHAFRNGFADRGPMHAMIAVRAQQATQKYLESDTSHESAARLGAKPTGWRKDNAKHVKALSDGEQAIVQIPRFTGLGRAFSDVVITPGSGKTYLTIPAHQTTYGKSIRDFPEDTFNFVIINSFRSFPAMMFAAGPHKGEVGYWLKRTITQKQDRKLLPADADYRKIARKAAREYLTEELRNS